MGAEAALRKISFHCSEPKARIEALSQPMQSNNTTFEIARLEYDGEGLLH
jgi:hypothetical protein